VRVAVVAEFYPRAHDPVLGIWAHRQAIATRDAGAQIKVFVLHRLVPPSTSFTPAEALRLARQPTRAELDDIPVRYVRFVSPARGRSYARWGAWAAPMLALALRTSGRFDLVHAHNAIPAANAVRRTGITLPLVVSVHGGDVLWTGANRVPGGRPAVSRALGAADLVLANSHGIADLCRAFGARQTRVVHLGTDIPDAAAPAQYPLLVTAGHLVARKRHADVIRALAQLPDEVRYLVIGDGPERATLAALAAQLGVSHRVELAGQLEHELALRRARQAWLFVMPSSEEAFGVAYIEAMAAGIPAIGATGEPGPAEIAACGGGVELVAAGDPAGLARTIGSLLSDRERLSALSSAARENVIRNFSWDRCGAETVAVYREVLSRAS
jgi:teichuronic acid biosynthesis glycosyltransferase TuaC